LGKDGPLGADETEGVCDCGWGSFALLECGVGEEVHWEADVEDLAVISDVSVVPVLLVITVESVDNQVISSDGGVVGDQTIGEDGFVSCSGVDQVGV